MSLQVYFAFVAACIALALLPGPVVTLVIANGLRHGTRAALTNILGVQVGLSIVIGIVAIGLTSLMATMGYWFDWVRFAGAAYLIWLGIKLIRAPVAGVKADAPPPPPRGGFFLQGFVVLLSNPKVLVFFGAFIPQFLDMSRDHVSRGLAGADAGAVSCSYAGKNPCARIAASISEKIRASRSAHSICPAGSAIKSWRISMPEFIRPRASPCTGMV
jgi:threonine/homoserine/homoserine lactone efflux protein